MTTQHTPGLLSLAPEFGGYSYDAATRTLTIYRPATPAMCGEAILWRGAVDPPAVGSLYDLALTIFRLIAAAPRLLEVLQETAELDMAIPTDTEGLQRWTGRIITAAVHARVILCDVQGGQSYVNMTDDEATEAVRAAIRKARGQ